jgi:3-methylfumaryl-CoA hydratase
MSLDIDHLRTWIGKTERRTDRVTPVPVMALAALLDRDGGTPQAGDPLPFLWHWLYFLPIARQSELGRDGHPARGGFLPPVPLARRMWAGSRLEFHRPLRIGEAISRTSTILDVGAKHGRAGALVFVRVRHDVSDGEGLLLIEEHDIVYRDAPKPDAPPANVPAPVDYPWRREIHPDPVMLFRYSALTFNGHRIHYDQPYATQVEGYPGLVVHGPLIATLLLDLLLRQRPEADVSGFSFRAMRPLYDTASFLICGEPSDDGKAAKLWTRDADGWMTMDAEATLRRSGLAPAMPYENG